MAITQFKGNYAFLSNFYTAPVTFDGLTYESNEAAFQAQKTLDLSERKRFAYMNPSEAKRAGRHVALRPDWEEVKNAYMLAICREKFIQNNGLNFFNDA